MPSSEVAAAVMNTQFMCTAPTRLPSMGPTASPAINAP